jgi:replicative DNA helicase
MNLHLLLVKLLLDFNHYVKYYDNINKDFIEANYPEISRLYKVLPELHGSGEVKTYTLEDLRICLLTHYPKADPDFYGKMLHDLGEAEVDPRHLESYVRSITERERAVRIAKKALRVADGQDPFLELTEALGEIETVISTEDDDPFVSDDLAVLNEQFLTSPGLRWRLASLNKSIGPLRKGDFGFVFARPETGKTTFIASETTFMAEQLSPDVGPIIWFNNEEQGDKVSYRCIQAALGMSRELLDSDIEKHRLMAFNVTHRKLRVIKEASLSKNYIEGICRRFQPSLIIFDQIDKIKGFMSDRHDLEMKAIYQWARELAKQYCPVIGVCQAGGSGDGKKWLTMNDVDSSKTAKQGEADWILGIGATYDSGSEYLRFFNVSKNKLHGDKDSDPKMRHGKWSTLIQPEIARYRDL